MLKTTLRTLIAATTLGLTFAATHAHQIWIEPAKDGQTAKVYYGEYAESHLETAGGELDKIASPLVYTTDPAKPLAVTRQKDHLQIPVQGPVIRFIETGLAPYPGRQGKTKYVFAGRYGRSQTNAVLPCEIVPVEPDSNTFEVKLNGTAVPKAKVTVVTGERWSKTFTADDRGRVTIETPTKGFYVLETAVPEAKSGGEGDQAYSRIVYVVTLSFVVK